ncbi:uncharacterized protein LOC119974969 isoform X3 [Scyliorhinus canicula]|uniref:uncharacterized protein LOC119974969 isoform X3 n=1 Tax=Scyliorhinus canicula TaxID=7830 RepID=UPI0018F2F3D6|nr:uncharacterized protein LOC119974969 isoform X3 [Scyliorhinus canicula]
MAAAGGLKRRNMVEVPRGSLALSFKVSWRYWRIIRFLCDFYGCICSPSGLGQDSTKKGFYADVQDQLIEDYQTQLAWQQFCRSLTTENNAGQAPRVDTWTEDANSKLENECLESEVLENTPSGPLVQTATTGRNLRRGTPKGSKWKLSVFVIVIVAYISGVSAEYCELINAKRLKCPCVPRSGCNVSIHSPAAGSFDIKCSESTVNDVSCWNAMLIDVQPNFMVLELSGESPNKVYVCENQFVTTETIPNNGTETTPNNGLETLKNVPPETIPNNGTETTLNNGPETSKNPWWAFVIVPCFGLCLVPVIWYCKKNQVYKGYCKKKTAKSIRDNVEMNNPKTVQAPLLGEPDQCTTNG